MKEISLEVIEKVCEGAYYGADELKCRRISSVVIDSRLIQPGSLFIAIKGERADGHSFVDAAYEAGAVCCITEKVPQNINGPVIVVKSSVEALKQLAAYYRRSLSVKVVGITGSVGKTSTKETVYSVLKEKYNTIKTLGNYNNEIGLPLTVFRIEEDTQVAVLEMGISDFNEMKELTRIAKPDVCVITNIGLCHLENLKDRDGVLKAKTEIFEGMDEGNTAVLNGDDDKLITVRDKVSNPLIYFGIDNKSGVYADSIESLGLYGTKVCIHNLATVNGVADIDLLIPVPGHHMIYNAMAAAAVGAVFGLTSDEIKNGIEAVETIQGRNHIVKNNSLLILDDCYNANPVSMKASVDVLDMAAGRKVAILGSMFELGEDEVILHESVGHHLATKRIDVLLTAGALASHIADVAGKENETLLVYSYDTRDELIEKLPDIINKGDNILVKASHGMEFTKIVDVLADMSFTYTDSSK